MVHDKCVCILWKKKWKIHTHARTHFMPIITIICIHLLDFYNNSLASQLLYRHPAASIKKNVFPSFCYSFLVVSLGKIRFISLNKVPKRMKKKKNAKKYPHCNIHFSFFFFHLNYLIQFVYRKMLSNSFILFAIWCIHLSIFLGSHWWT